MANMTIFQKIQAGKKMWEKSILTAVKYYNKKGEGYLTGLSMNPIPYWNALERLEKNGKIEYSRRGKKHKGYWLN